MKKQKKSVYVILFCIMLLIAASAGNQQLHQLSQQNLGHWLKNQKIELNSEAAEESEVVPLFFNFLSTLFYKFAK